MTDLIIKRSPISIEEAKARGAWIVDDNEPGTGFQEDADENVGCVSGKAGTPEHQMAYDHPDVVDAQKRAEDAKIVSEVHEETLRLREESTNAVRKFRFNHQQDYLEWVPGRILKIGQFLGMLQTIRPDAFVAERQFLGLRGLGFVQGGTPVYSGTSVQDVMPEWSQLKVDIHGLPIREKYRGWRTVLLQCIKKDFLTSAQCDEVFRAPLGPRSKPWFRSLWEIRNGKCGECRKQFCDCMDRYDFLRADNYQYALPEDVIAGKQQKLEESRIYVP